jgi:hypothetical protein
MTTKLTLSLDNDVIVSAKSYAKLNRTSLSVLVENYFRLLTQQKMSEKKDVSPIVSELSGVIKYPKDLDIKEEYRKYISEKYS